MMRRTRRPRAPATDSRMARVEMACSRGTRAGEEGRFEDAADAFRQALAIAPEYHDARIGLGLALGWLGHREEAVDTLEHVLSVSPGHPGALIALGMLRMGWGDYSAAAMLLDRAAEARPDLPSLVDLLTMLAQAHLSSGAPARARNVAERLVAMAPDSPESHLLLARALSGLHDDAGAREAAERALFLDPHHGEALLLVASTFLTEGRWREALNPLDRLLEIEPQDARAHAGLALALAGLGRRGVALREADRALQLNGGEPAALLLAAQAYARLGQWRQVAAAGQRLVSATPDRPGGYVLLGQAAVALGDGEGLLAACDALSGIRPEAAQELLAAAQEMGVVSRRTRRRPARSGTQPAERRIYQIRVTMRETVPSIWRRLLVPGDVKLSKLHRILQASFGWTNSHLHEFIVGARAYSEPTFEVENASSERHVTLQQVAPAVGARLVYLYDFGDSWRHDIEVEEIHAPAEGEQYPRCLAGRRKGPPEDVGGVYGLEQFLEAIADPDHEEHDSYLEWFGADYDPDDFDAEEVNRALARVR